jgi:hypothetical protein
MVEAQMSDRGETTTEQGVKRNPDGTFAKGSYPTTGFHTNPERRHNGSWHKEGTARYKMETIMKMSDEELLKAKEKGATTFERAFANVLYLARTATDVEEAKKCMDILEKMTNQVYGPMPQVQVAVEADDETKEETNKIIRGFALP